MHMEPPDFGAFAAQPSGNRRVNSHITAVASLDRDAELMLLVRDGDQACFGLLLAKHRLAVIHFLFRMVQNQAVAEELAQEVFFRVYRSRNTYEPTAKFTTWLFRIAARVALNSIRDGRSEKQRWSLDGKGDDGVLREVPDCTRTAEQELLYRVKLREVREAIETLP